MPSTAFSLLTLESYRLIRLKKPSFSIQAFVQSLCDSSGTQYSISLRNLLSDAFDAYLAILRIVDARIRTALGRNDRNWHIKNSCPCCNHRVRNEPPLLYDHIFSVDGGSSCKRFRDAGTAFSPDFSSDYYICPTEVDVYKHEAVKKTVKKNRKGKGGGKSKTHTNGSSMGTVDDGDGLEEDEGQQADIVLEVGAPAIQTDEDGQEWIIRNIQAEPGLEHSTDLTHCVERWKANADDDKKGMFECFDEAGIFIAVCRHGFLLAFCDIIQSGEL
jgi:hypothetical protein